MLTGIRAEDVTFGHDLTVSLTVGHGRAGLVRGGAIRGRAEAEALDSWAIALATALPKRAGGDRYGGIRALGGVTRPGERRAADGVSHRRRNAP